MRRRFVQVVVIMSMLSACAGSGGRDPGAIRTDIADNTPRHLEHRRRNLDLESTTERYRRSQYRAAAHHHHEPTPDELYAGQIALLLSAQVFACAFFVVILDGSCNFYASTGFYY